MAVSRMAAESAELWACTGGTTAIRRNIRDSERMRVLLIEGAESGITVHPEAGSCNGTGMKWPGTVAIGMATGEIL
jgi:hypothetical protein